MIRDMDNMLYNIYLIEDEMITLSHQYEVLPPLGAKAITQMDTSQEQKLQPLIEAQKKN